MTRVPCDDDSGAAELSLERTIRQRGDFVSPGRGTRHKLFFGRRQRRIVAQFGRWPTEE
jgi:hypothetical protein